MKSSASGVRGLGHRPFLPSASSRLPPPDLPLSPPLPPYLCLFLLLLLLHFSLFSFVSFFHSFLQLSFIHPPRLILPSFRPLPLILSFLQSPFTPPLALLLLFFLNLLFFRLFFILSFFFLLLFLLHLLFLLFSILFSLILLLRFLLFLTLLLSIVLLLFFYLSLFSSPCFASSSSFSLVLRSPSLTVIATALSLSLLTDLIIPGPTVP